jgi:hypothetical protein
MALTLEREEDEMNPTMRKIKKKKKKEMRRSILSSVGVFRSTLQSGNTMYLALSCHDFSNQVFLLSKSYFSIWVGHS